MTFSKAIVEARLADRPHRFFESVPSTMDVARDWLLAGEAPHGAMVIAAEQTAGRGRMGRPWLNAGECSLAVSAVLKLPGAALPQVPMFGGLVVLDTLSALHVPDVSLKWPNDVLIGDRKVCGVLVETAWDGAYLRGAILGIGLNVVGSVGGPAVALIAISIADALGVPPDLSTLFSTFVDNFDRRLPDLNTPQTYHAWRARLGTIGRRVRVEGAMACEGIAEDATDSGALLVRADDGTLRTVLAGDVRLRPA